MLQDELWYIAMDDLELGPVIGEGTFGKVGEDGICVCLSVCLLSLISMISMMSLPPSLSLVDGCRYLQLSTMVLE